VIALYRKIIIELLVMIVYGLAIGMLLAIAANAFIEGVNIASAYRVSSSWALFDFKGSTYSFSGILFLLLAALILKLLKVFLKIDAWGGPADSIYAAHDPNPELSVKKGFGSTLSAFIVASSGGSVGQYGPLVHFGSTAGLLFKKIVTNRLNNDVLIGCGVAAAISAGFNAPLAGVIFAHEAILRHFSLRAIAPIFIASISANAFSQSLFGATDNIFNLSQTVPALGEIIPIFLILGPIFSLIAIVFMVSLRFMSAFASSSVRLRSYLPFIAAIICGIVGTFFPEILGIGIEPINQIIANQFSIQYVFALLVAKISMTALCIGFGLFGGVFSPALFIGVTTGSVATFFLSQLGQAGIEQVVIISAMAAVSASVIGAPISIIIIVLELTGSYDYAIAAMMAVVISSLITNRVFGSSFFDRQLLDRGINMALGRESIALHKTKVSSCEGTQFVRLEVDTAGVDAYKLMETAGVVEAYVLTDDDKFFGKLTLYDAVRANDEAILKFIDHNPFSLCESDSLHHAMHKITDFVGESIPIISTETDTLKTVLTEGNIFQAVLDIQNTIRKIEKD
jgi:CIC family chloride channel protein